MASLRSQDICLPLIGKLNDSSFSQLRLPTNLDVLRRFTFFMRVKNQTRKQAINSTYGEIVGLWKKISGDNTKNYACYRSKTAVKRKLERLMDEYKRVTANAQRKQTHSQKEKTKSYEQTFTSNLNNLFDISKDNAKARLTGEDYAFLEDQRGARVSTFGRRDLTTFRKLHRKKKKAELVAINRQLRSSEEGEFSMTMSAALETSTSEDSEEGTSSSVSADAALRKTPRDKLITLHIPSHISALPQVIEAAERHKLSNNALNDILAALVRDCGGDVNDFVLSKSTTLRNRRIYHLEKFEDIKAIFKGNMKDEFCSIHWDEKLLREGDDFEAREHIAILVSYKNNSKLLGTLALERGTGMSQATAINNIISDWEIEQRCVAMCFDTTAANRGKFPGACILLEGLLGHSLLWTACRHHIWEIILAHVVKDIFGKSKGPKVDFFDILKKKWLKLDLKKDLAHIVIGENVHEDDVSRATIQLQWIYGDEESYVPRDDYKEFLEL